MSRWRRITNRVFVALSTLLCLGGPLAPRVSAFSHTAEERGRKVELNGSLAPERVYQWGLDLSGTQHGAGGVGGLLAMKDLTAGKVYYYTYEGNGNVQQVVESETRNTVADYSYGPFGEPLRATGATAQLNPFRFSTKYQDPETGLLYYGHRFYQSETGTWLSRDPLGEAAGRPLYSFVGNNPVGSVDPIGLYELSNPFTWGDGLGYQGTGLGYYRPGDATVGLKNIGSAFWGLASGLVKLPYVAADAAGYSAGELWYSHGEVVERGANRLAILRALAEDECFRQQILAKLGNEFGDYLSNPENWSSLLAEGGVSAATMGLGNAAKAGRLAELLERIERLLPGKFGTAAAKATPQNVFWSGGRAAEDAARSFANANNGIIIGDTAAGRALAQATESVPWSQARPQWLSMSEDLARSASGEVNVFQNSRGLSLDSIWRSEFKVLQQNPNVSGINYHVVMPDGAVIKLP